MLLGAEEFSTSMKSLPAICEETENDKEKLENWRDNDYCTDPPIVTDGEFVIGMKFNSREVVVVAIKDYTIRRGVDYQVYESEPTTFYAKYVQYGNNCNWLIKQKSLPSICEETENDKEKLENWRDNDYYTAPSSPFRNPRKLTHHREVETLPPKLTIVAPHSLSSLSPLTLSLSLSPLTLSLQEETLSLSPLTVVAPIHHSPALTTLHTAALLTVAPLRHLALIVAVPSSPSSSPPNQRKAFAITTHHSRRYHSPLQEDSVLTHIPTHIHRRFFSLRGHITKTLCSTESPSSFARRTREFRGFIPLTQATVHFSLFEKENIADKDVSEMFQRIIDACRVERISDGITTYGREGNSLHPIVPQAAPSSFHLSSNRGYEFYCSITLMTDMDFTIVPVVVDLACVRDAMNRLDNDSNKINPLESTISSGMDCSLVSFIVIYELIIYPVIVFGGFILFEMKYVTDKATMQEIFSIDHESRQQDFVIKLYIEFEHLTYSVEEADGDMDWKGYSSESEDEFEGNYKIDDPSIGGDDVDYINELDVEEVANVLTRQHPFEKPSFMRTLDLVALNASEFFEYLTAYPPIVTNDKFVIGIEFSSKEVVVVAIKEAIKSLVEADLSLKVRYVIGDVQAKFNYTMNYHKA
ncbi:hypothetical protein Ahy_A02g006817 [Arachis hypogaea]|uniref:Transposase MuDR plant domain-containing protein n=1 Tax=Arachis hypogaea TaxID=3818 RepID=A0A445EAT5_ARAHY|nr:hypothetical protein Ahy_A02g006817 [Arachis hypogaea]